MKRLIINNVEARARGRADAVSSRLRAYQNHKARDVIPASEPASRRRKMVFKKALAPVLRIIRPISHGLQPVYHWINPGNYRGKQCWLRAASLVLALFLIITVIADVGRAHALSQGPLGTTSGVDNSGVGTVAWTSPGSVTIPDSVYANQSLGSAVVGHYLVATGFGFTVPTGSTINGIVAEVEENATTASKAQIQDNAVRIVQGGTVQTTDRSKTSAWPSSNAFVSYGSSSDLWGATWTVAQINASNFGVAVSAQNVKISNPGATLTANIDYIRMTVYYTPPPTLASQNSYRLYNNQDASTQTSFIKAWGSGAKDEEGHGVVQTSDGGYAVTGWTTSFGAGSNDMFLAKYDNSGNLSWSRTWGGTGTDDGYSVVQTSDGGYAVTGDTASFGAGGSDMFLAKYDSSGTLSWSRTWAAVSGTFADQGNSLVQTSDGGYAVTGYTNGGSDVFLAKYDSSGTLSWSKVWTGTGAEQGNSVVQTSDGGYAVTGFTASFGAGSDDMFLIKYDSSGNVSWNKTWGGTSADRGNSVVQTSDGGYAVTGFSYSFGASSTTFPDAFLAKYDSSGTLSWSRTWGASGDTSKGYSVVQASDGGYAIAGSMFDSDADMFLAKYDSSGNISGCSGTNCQSPSATSGSPSATASSPSATSGSPSATSGSPSATVFADGTNYTSTKTTWVALGPSVDVGSALAAQNTSATIPNSGIFRMRLDLAISNFQLDPAVTSYKLQYAKMSGACDTAFSGETYADVTTTTPIAYYDNTNAISGLPMATNANDPTDSTNTLDRQDYLEAGTTTFPPTSIVPTGQDAMWDFALKIGNGALAGDQYCLRVVDGSGSVLNAYTVIPQVTVPAAAYNQAAYRWFDQGNQLAILSFASAVNYTAQTNGDNAQVADFNGDGYPDVVVGTTNAGGNIGVFLNNGNGTFGAVATYTPSAGLHRIAVADFNGDGHPDFAVTNQNSNTVGVFINNGNGTFAAQVSYTLGASTDILDITAADFNGDGHPDIAAAGNSTPNSQVAVLINNGNGTFGSAANYTVGANSKGITSGDFNGDGYPDIASADFGGNTVSVLMNNGDGTFASAVTYTSKSLATVITAADLNGDGHPDLLVGTFGTSFYVMLNNGSGGFNSTTYTSSGLTDAGIKVADINGDSMPDAIIGADSTSNVEVWIGDGDGGFNGTQTVSSGSNPHDVVTGDFNQDGLPDIAAVLSGGTVVVLMNTTSYQAPLAATNKILVPRLQSSFRLRLAIAVDGGGVAASAAILKLQYAVKSGSCAASTYADISTTTPVQWFDNTNITGGAAIGDTVNDPTFGSYVNKPQTYQEANNFTNVATNIYNGQAGLWDFSLQLASGTSVGTDICIRAVTSTGTALSTYTVFPEIQYGASNNSRLRGGKFFDAQGLLHGLFLP